MSSLLMTSLPSSWRTDEVLAGAPGLEPVPGLGAGPHSKMVRARSMSSMATVRVARGRRPDGERGRLRRRRR